MAIFVEAGGGIMGFNAATQFKILGSLSVTFWLKPISGMDTSQVYFALENSPTPDDEPNNAIVYISCGGTTSGAMDLSYIHEYGAGTNYSFTSNSNLTHDVWQHIALVRDHSARSVTFYKDGVDVGGSTYTSGQDPTMSASDIIMMIGSRRTITTNESNSHYAEVLLFDRALTDGERFTAMYSPRVLAPGAVMYQDCIRNNARGKADLVGGATPYESATLSTVEHPPVAWGARSFFSPAVVAAAGTIAPQSYHHRQHNLAG